MLSWLVALFAIGVLFLLALFFGWWILALPFVLVIFLAVHFWRIRKDGGISGPL